MRPCVRCRWSPSYLADHVPTLKYDVLHVDQLAKTTTSSVQVAAKEFFTVLPSGRALLLSQLDLPLNQLILVLQQTI